VRAPIAGGSGNPSGGGERRAREGARAVFRGKRKECDLFYFIFLPAFLVYLFIFIFAFLVHFFAAVCVRDSLGREGRTTF